MSFVSYAQNFEDVMLWRALKQVKNGFYIDVGANDPNVDSVTKAFYERGWRGINIEPLTFHHRDLERERPNDINLCCAAGAQNGELELWECEIRGWATVSNTVVEQHKKEGHEGIFHKVPVVPLSDICARYVTNEIHFLKIDVEGFEKSVIEGMDFSLFRPWVVVVEATQPNSTEEVYEEWSNTLLAADYVFAYADGLNRFYGSREHSEILTSLRYPPNVFDEFIRSEQLNSELRAQQAQEHADFAEAQSQQIDQKCTWLETEWDAAKQRIEELSKSSGRLETELAAEQTKAINLALELNAANEHNNQLQAQVQQLHGRLIAVHQSTSWYVTKPLRAVKRLLGGDFLPIRQVIQAAELLAKKILRPPLAALIKYFFDHEKMRASLSPWFKRIPWLHQRLLRVGVNTGVVPPLADNLVTPPQFDQRQEATFPEGELNLTPRARRIYVDLKAAIDHFDKEND